VQTLRRDTLVLLAENNAILVVMAEILLDVRHQPKAAAYGLVHDAAEQILFDSGDDVTAMATMSSLLHHGFGFLWTGFYRVVSPGLLRVGPYQGTVGCLEIPFGKGVCGTAAAEQRAVIVPNVDLFPGHIACDARSRSEIVVPVFDSAHTLIAVLDIDADRVNAFDAADEDGLTRLLEWFARRQPSIGMTPLPANVDGAIAERS
jgi:GAF domain-containing protein